MNNREIVQALMDAVQKGDFASAKKMLSDDFQFSGPIPEPINAEAWLEMSANLKIAFRIWITTLSLAAQMATRRNALRSSVGLIPAPST